MHNADIQFWTTCMVIGTIFTGTMFACWQADGFAGLFLFGLLSVCWIGVLFVCAIVLGQTTR